MKEECFEGKGKERIIIGHRKKKARLEFTE